MRFLLNLLLVSVMLCPASLVTAQTQANYDVDQTTGLRMERYRAPVPEDVPEATTIDSAEAQRLHAAGNAVFVDVYPPKGLGPDPLDGHWIITEERLSIPDAVWLPEVGRGSLQPDAMAFFERNLNRLSNGDKQAAIVLFCTADCWQSWNATRRAYKLGYTNLYWYPLGTDGWLEHGQTLTLTHPVNFFDDTITLPEANDEQ